MSKSEDLNQWGLGSKPPEKGGKCEDLKLKGPSLPKREAGSGDLNQEKLELGERFEFFLGGVLLI
ncbi:hypothetical protein GCM10026987_34220 [Belliella aquatica]|uniref:Uncharacterized protein n=1 Tax=Belliella aquatica TaxID=1323734 RepID=A0ABQ1LZX6_9BACT|nr:hypothetical protein GCM10010993_07930 [Belliella aquatica]